MGMRVCEKAQESSFGCRASHSSEMTWTISTLAQDGYAIASTLTSDGFVEDDEAAGVVQPLDPVAAPVVLPVDKDVLDVAGLQLLAKASEGEYSCGVDGLLAWQHAADAWGRGRWDGAVTRKRRSVRHCGRGVLESIQLGV